MQKRFREFEELVFFDFRIPDSGFRFLVSEFSGSGFRFPVSSFSFRFPVSGFLDLGLPVKPRVSLKNIQYGVADCSKSSFGRP